MTADTAADPKFFEVRIDFDDGRGLPMDIASTLMRLLGTAYPHSMIGPAPRFGGMSFRIPDSDREREFPADEDLVADPADTSGLDVKVTDIGSGGVGFTTPKEIADLCLPLVKGMFEDFPEAENYLEMRCNDAATGDMYVLSFARSARQTPGELRRAAEAKHDAILSEMAAAAAEFKTSNDHHAFTSEIRRIVAASPRFTPVA